MLCKSRYLQQGGFLRKVSFLPWHGLSYSTYSDSRGKNHKATPLQERRMIDRFSLHVKGGEGGSGNASVRRNRTNRFGKPDGGNGGKGGDVILKCTSAVWDFRGLQHHINGKKGGNGSSKNQIGSPGEDKVVQVPVGTVIHLVQGNIPSSVEMPSAGTHPWDTPGTLTPDILVSDEESFSMNKPSMQKGEDCVNISSSGTAKHISSLNPCAQGSSIRTNAPPFSSRGNSTLCEKALVSNHDDEKIYKSMPADAYNLENDGGFSEETSEEEEDLTQYNFAELTEDGQQIIIARGGEGGLGSVSSNRHPKKASKYTKHDFRGNDNIDDCGEEDQPSLRAGLPGSQASLILELKSIADVGFVGMPNAGKSTLLGVISKAKPAVGDYSFTTLRPNLGKLNYDEVSITVADIPGLISGAHQNRGLGHDFLRHIERTKLLVYVVDLAAALDDRKGIPPWEQLRDLVVELECYREGLSDRPSLVVANKTDENGAEGVLEELQERVQGIPIYPVCAILKEGIPELKAALRQLVNGGESARLRLENILID